MKNHKNYKEKSSNSKTILFFIRGIYRNKSEISKFYSVGAIGLFINYFVSFYFFTYFHFDHLHSSIVGIIVSLSSNFLLNKIWTFKDKNMNYDIVLKQYLKYFIFNKQIFICISTNTYNL